MRSGGTVSLCDSKAVVRKAVKSPSRESRYINTEKRPIDCQNYRTFLLADGKCLTVFDLFYPAKEQDKRQIAGMVNVHPAERGFQFILSGHIILLSEVVTIQPDSMRRDQRWIRLRRADLLQRAEKNVAFCKRTLRQDWASVKRQFPNGSAGVHLDKDTTSIPR